MEKKKFWGAHMPILGGGGGGGAPSVRSALFFIPPFFRYSPCICEVRDLPTSVPNSRTSQTDAAPQPNSLDHRARLLLFGESRSQPAARRVAKTHLEEKGREEGGEGKKH